ncbi:MAG: CocE/NonD family hydrolase [Dongiaceae bacterium]
MKIVSEFPRKTREIENVFIPLSDGTRLAARIWLPEDAEQHPVPAILEYLPYRKRDGTYERDANTHPYFAGHGYAGVRVDIRGTGESDGVLLDEYLKLEQDDCLEVLRWLAQQPWCTGACGMIGISWGGFNGLQVAARRPPDLKAIVSICSTDDRFADDIHAMGGCQLIDNMAWASAMFTLQTHPPDPALVGERWREMWRERLENLPLLIDNWLKHQRRDSFWKHGSVCENFADITCAVYAVGGWNDGYSNAVPRLLSGLTCPKKGLVGPWAHRYPHFAEPGPRIGFMLECVRWWDHWLKGRDTGIMKEPTYRAWLEDWVPPKPHVAEWPGRWVTEPSWPSPNIKPKSLALTPDGLRDKPAAERALTHRSPLGNGYMAGHWCPYGHAPDLPSDQREDDGKSLLFDSEPLAERLDILGAPVVTLELSADRSQAQVCARLNDLAPDGSSLRVSYGMLNLAHRDSHEFPEPLKPGARYRARVKLNDIAYAFPTGHRIRIALSSSYWPIAWPSPQPVNLTIHTGGSHLELPVRPARAEDKNVAPFPPAEISAPAKTVQHTRDRTIESVTRDLITGETVFTTDESSGLIEVEHIGMSYEHSKHEEFSIRDDDPISARAEITNIRNLSRGDWRIRTITHTVMRATESEWLVDAQLDAYEGDSRFVSRSWSVRHKRDCT